MIRIVSAAAALCLMSGLAMAEPVKLTDTQLQDTHAGQISVLNGFQLSFVNQTGAAVGIFGHAHQSNYATVVQLRNVRYFGSIFD